MTKAGNQSKSQEEHQIFHAECVIGELRSRYSIRANKESQGAFRNDDITSASRCDNRVSGGPSRTEAEHPQPRFGAIDGPSSRIRKTKKKSAPDKSHALPLDRCVSDADPPDFFAGVGRSSPSLALRNQLRFRSAAGPQGDSITTLPSA